MADTTSPLPVRRARSPHGSGGQLRTELIDAAGMLLASGVSPDNLSLRGVARAAGVAAPSVYLHFASKDELIQAVVAHHFAQLGAAMQAGIDAATTPVERLRGCCRGYLDFAAESPGAYRIIFESPYPQRDRNRDADGALFDAEDHEGDADDHAFHLLAGAVADCLPSADTAQDRAFMLACDIWVALHGMISLRRNLPAFPWPPSDVQLARIIAPATQGRALE